MALADPVELVAVVAVAGVLGPEQLAVGRERQPEAVARAVGEEVAARRQRGRVGRDDEVGGVGGDAEDGRRERDLAEPGEVALGVLDLTVVRPRAAVEGEPLAAGVDRHGAQVVVVGRPPQRVRLGLGDGRPDAPARLGAPSADDADVHRRGRPAAHEVDRPLRPDVDPERPEPLALLRGLRDERQRAAGPDGLPVEVAVGREHVDGLLDRLVRDPDGRDRQRLDEPDLDGVRGRRLGRDRRCEGEEKREGNEARHGGEGRGDQDTGPPAPGAP